MFITVKRLRIEKNAREEADKFEVVAEKGTNACTDVMCCVQCWRERLTQVYFVFLEFEQTENSLQINDITVS